jgi:hypothetical protein
VLQEVFQKDKFRDSYKKFCPSFCYFVRIIIPVILFAVNSPHDLSPHAENLELLSFYIFNVFIRIQVSLVFVNYGPVHGDSKECLGKDSGKNGEMNTAPGIHARLENM